VQHLSDQHCVRLPAREADNFMRGWVKATSVVVDSPCTQEEKKKLWDQVFWDMTGLRSEDLEVCRDATHCHSDPTCTPNSSSSGLGQRKWSRTTRTLAQ